MVGTCLPIDIVAASPDVWPESERVWMIHATTGAGASQGPHGVHRKKRVVFRVRCFPARNFKSPSALPSVTQHLLRISSGKEAGKQAWLYKSHS